MSVRQENRWKKRVIEEGRKESDRQREIEAMFMERKPRPLAAAPQPNPSRRQVRSWMRANAHDYEDATHLAEAANAEFKLPADWLDSETHWIWEEALDAVIRARGD